MPVLAKRLVGIGVKSSRTRSIGKYNKEIKGRRSRTDKFKKEKKITSTGPPDYL